MKKIFKICPSLIAVALVTTTLVGNSTVASAATKSTAIQNSSIQQNQNNAKITNTSQAIKLIESKFLVRNSDGTTSIDSNAENYISSDTLNVIKNGSNAINKKIRSGDLRVIKSSNKLIQNPTKKNSKIKTNGVYVDGDYIWHWYGFDFVMDSQNAGLAAVQLNTYANQLMAAGAGAGFVGKITFGLANSATAYVCYGYANDCALGEKNGRGAILYFYGDPSWAQLYNSSVR